MGTVAQRFADKHQPDHSTGCWIWTARVSKWEYGVISVGRKTVYAHRLSYELHRGPIPAGMFVCHKCDTPRCVNPDHLFLGTPGDNMRDKVAKGRQAQGDRNGSRTRPDRLPRGERHGRRTMPASTARGGRHGNAKLTEEIVAYIRTQRSVSHAVLAARFGVNRSVISEIQAGKTWRHV